MGHRGAVGSWGELNWVVWEMSSAESGSGSAVCRFGAANSADFGQRVQWLSAGGLPILLLGCIPGVEWWLGCGAVGMCGRRGSLRGFPAVGASSGIEQMSQDRGIQAARVWRSVGLLMLIVVLGNLVGCHNLKSHRLRRWNYNDSGSRGDAFYSVRDVLSSAAREESTPVYRPVVPRLELEESVDVGREVAAGVQGD